MTPVMLNKIVPPFSASKTGGGEFNLEDFKGHIIVLYFYPKDNTPGCTTEGIEFNNLYKKFQQNNAIVVGVSRDSLRSHDNFKCKYSFNFDLLSDSDEEICQLFDVIKEKNMYGKKVLGIERSTFVINEKGVLIGEFRKVKAAGHAQEILNFIKDKA